MAALSAIDSPRTLIDDLIEEQQQLTAVDRFSRRYDQGGGHAQEPYYRDLIPLSLPGRGEQYAFAVDLDACTGCKACVSACHSLNGLDEDEIWRTAGLLHGGGLGQSYQQTITTACHHCVEPGCLQGCPVMAYEKDEHTGIVRHLDDQCIGCQYCVLKCPYDVPKYSKKKGIVRKCDMCSSRLSAGEAPACVQACPTSAIRIQLVEVSALLADSQPGTAVVPGAFDSSYTKPSTQYRSERTMPRNARSGDAEALRLEHAHWPLILMLVLTQMAAGLSTVVLLMTCGGSASDTGRQAIMAGSAFVVLQLGLAVSVFHLGRPFGAWRFFLGLRTSWMSREILAFSLFAASAGATAAVSAVSWIGDVYNWPVFAALQVLIAPSACVTALCGASGVFCSAMIYIDTRRTYWQAALTFPKFIATTLLLGAAGGASILAACNLFLPQHAAAALIAGWATVLLRAVIFAGEWARFRRCLSKPEDANHRSALVIWRLRRPLALGYCGLTAVAMALSLLALASSGWGAALLTSAALALTMAAQGIERYFYFTAVIAPRMPGTIA